MTIYKAVEIIQHIEQVQEKLEKAILEKDEQVISYNEIELKRCATMKKEASRVIIEYKKRYGNV